MKNQTRTLAALGAAVIIAGGAAGVACSAGAQAKQFGYATVRSGIPQGVSKFKVNSPELASGSFPAADYASSFGCTAANNAPTLNWSGAPAETKSFAVTMFDVDAPTGSGLWHWINFDIPAKAHSYKGTWPAGTVTGTNDAGNAGYLGPCPGAGDIAHHYLIRVLALDTANLGLSASTPSAIEVSQLSDHIIGEAALTATAQR